MILYDRIATLIATLFYHMLGLSQPNDAHGSAGLMLCVWGLQCCGCAGDEDWLALTQPPDRRTDLFAWN